MSDESFNSDTSAIEKSTNVENFIDFQNNAIDYLYDLSVANDSLFIGFLTEGTIDNTNNLSKIKDEKTKIKYRIQKISFSGVSFKSEKDELRRLELITGYEGNNKVKITYYEDSVNSIEKWTYKYMNNFFNFSSGTFKSLDPKKIPYLCLDVYRYNFIENENGEITPNIHGRIHFDRLIPLGGINLNFDSTSGNDIKTVEVEYIFSKCDYISYKDILEKATENSEATTFNSFN